MTRLLSLLLVRCFQPHWIYWAAGAAYIALYLYLSLLALPANAQTTVDGDTLKLSGTTYRLFGIDAPELHQTCADGWQAGKASADGLRSLLEGKTLTCEPMGHDRYGRTIGRCRAIGIDIGAEMVRKGLAWAYSKYSLDYVQIEDQARALRVGIHLHQCEPAWEYRKHAR